MSLHQVRRWLSLALLAASGQTLAARSLAAQAGVITGKVTQASTGQPIANAQVQAQVAGSPAYGAITGADGAFRVANLPDGSYTVTVRALGFAQRVFPGIRPGGTVTAALIERPTQLNQTVVTASRSRPEKALDAPAQISVITSEQIAERPAVTVTDHLRNTPGVDINRGGLAQSNVVARGFNNAFSGSMLILQDYRFAGVPSLRVNVPFLMTGTNEDIDRMEVLLGPASALYGPNSSNGVLHVITKSPFASAGTTISVDGGERDVLRAGIRHAGVVNEKMAFKLSGEYFRGNDWEYVDRSEPTLFPGTANVPASRRGQANNRNFDLEKYSGEARVDFRPAEGMEAITTLGYTNVGNGIELTGANGSAQIRNWTYTSLQQRFRWNRLFAQAFINLSDAGNDTLTSDAGTYLLRSGQPIVDQSRVAAGQIQHGFDLSAKQTFTYGADYIWTNPRTGATINGSNEARDNVTEYGAYLQSSTKPIKELEILLAARGDANNVIKGQFFSPRAAFIIKPTENQNIRLTYNRAFSTPANFSFFLDLIQTPNIGGSGFDVVARGNPPKEGWQFRRDCGGGLCMKSRFTGGGQFVAANAGSAFGPLVGGNSAALTPAFTQGIQGALQQAGFTAAQASALAPGLATGLVQHLATRQPTSTELATRISYLGTSTPLPATAVQDISPLAASFNDTYEFGYKGIVNNRFRYDVSFWTQRRGDVGTSAALVTPNVFFGDTLQLQGYIRTQASGYLAGALQQVAGLPAANAAVLGGAIGAALGPSVGRQFAPAPLGVVTFDSPTSSPTAVYATYLTSAGEIWVNGLDFAADLVANDQVTLDVAYSWQNKNIFEGINGGNSLPLMSNAPRSRGSLGVRYRNENRGFNAELRTRYNEAYPVNSGVYANDFAFPLAAGQPGAAANARGGARACNPAPAGTFCYENVPEATTFDAQVSKKFELGSETKLTWTLSATNLTDNRIRTFPGVPEIGRMLMTRIQYSF